MFLENRLLFSSGHAAAAPTAIPSPLAAARLRLLLLLALLSCSRFISAMFNLVYIACTDKSTKLFDWLIMRSRSQRSRSSGSAIFEG
jgi:hypothetical protein